MFEPWLRSQYQRPRIRVETLASVLVHAGIVWLAAYRTTAPEQAESTLYNRVYYLPPPDARPASNYSEEHIEYLALPEPGPTAGAGASAKFAGGAPSGESVVRGDVGRDYATTPLAPLLPGNDSVFTELEVDSAAVRYYWSAAPQYPADLLEKHIQGSVRAEYVVDSLGFADSSSFVVLRATHPGFTRAVRAALPRMRFSPARIGERHVSQIVQQDFVFRIQEPPRKIAEHKGSGST